MHDRGTEAKQEIKKLIELYDTVKLAKNEDKYLEPRVKSTFIEPLLDALGWKRGSNEVYPEYPVGRDWVDYALQVGGVGEEPKIFVEAKKFILPEGLDGKERDPYTEENISFPEKAIKYAWRKNVDWVILTNFKELRIYNAKRSKIPKKAEWFRTTYDKYLDEETFKTLWAFSREGVASGLLDAFEVRGKRKQVGKQFLDDLIKCRLLLIGNIRRLNKELKPELLKECVQRILDRLVIMRAAEDLGIEKFDRLRVEVLESKEGWDKLNQWLFKNFNERFNGSIFARHPCDGLKIDNEVIQEVVNILYNGTGESSGYRFDQIRADVLGSMYEDYIGYILKEEGDVFKLEKEMGERKAGGIYYTPAYVVEFIVENTLGTLLEEIRPSEIKNIHILDPACGSGSFLTKAQDVLKRHYESTIGQLKRKEGEKLDFYISKDYASLSKDILIENIYGVDLDSQAAEIASVNLSLKILADAKKEMKLPEVMGENIKVGNSLISSSEHNLKKYFEHVVPKKPFNWEEEFSYIFEQGKFDVVVGNPPWGAKLDEDEREFFKHTFGDVCKGTIDSYKLFIKRGLDLLKKNGVFGYIVPDTLLYQADCRDVRELILKTCEIKYIINLGQNVFGGKVANPCCIIILKKSEQNRGNNIVKTLDVSHLHENNEKAEVVAKTTTSNEWILTPQSLYEKTPHKSFYVGIVLHSIKLKEKLDKFPKFGDKIELMTKGVETGGNEIFIIEDEKLKQKLSSSLLKPVIEGKNIERYGCLGHKHLIYTDKSLRWENVPKPAQDYLLSMKGYRKRTKKGEIIRLLEERIKVKNGLIEWWQLNNPKTIALFTRERILLRQTGDSLIATIDDGRYFTIDSIHNIILKKHVKESYNYVLALLNSKLLNFYYQNFLAKEKGRVYAQVKNVNVFKLPYREIDFSNKKDRLLHDKIIELVNKMILLIDQSNKINTDFERYLTEPVIAETSFGDHYDKLSVDEKEALDKTSEGNIRKLKVEEQGDWLVFKADYITRKRGQKHEFKNVEIVKCGFKDELLRKFLLYTINNYKKPLGTGNLLSKILRVPLPCFDKDPKKNELIIVKMMKEFLKAVREKEQLEKEIQETDKMIDQKVYGLYGLTDEEIKIVEGEKIKQKTDDMN